MISRYGIFHLDMNIHLSNCQHRSIILCSETGVSIGAGNRYPAMISEITYNGVNEEGGEGEGEGVPSD